MSMIFFIKTITYGYFCFSCIFNSFKIQMIVVTANARTEMELSKTDTENKTSSIARMFVKLSY